MLADVLENVFCLYCIYQTIRRDGNKIVPSDVSVISNPPRKSLTKRSSSVYSLVQDLKDGSTSNKEKRGTLLFIAAILLQRELVETMVPIQALLVISTLYFVDVKANSVVSNWISAEDYYQAMTYTSIDLAVELVVFVCTILALRRVLPNTSAWKILSGLIRMHTIPMFQMMVLSWTAVLGFQNIFFGVDVTWRFEWVRCNGKSNSTWLGGFNWEC